MGSASYRVWSAAVVAALCVGGCSSGSTSPSNVPAAISGLIGTGVTLTNGVDAVWEVECTPINISTPACPVSVFQAARRVGPPYGAAWVTPPSNGSWIGATSTGSIPDGASDSSERYQYIYRMQFDLTGFDPSTVKMSLEWAADNYFGGYRLNASSFVGGGSANARWEAFQTLTLQSPSDTFVAGRNLLEFRVVGDGVTDGFVVRNFQGTALRK